MQSAVEMLSGIIIIVIIIIYYYFFFLIGIPCSLFSCYCGFQRERVGLHYL